MIKEERVIEQVALAKGDTHEKKAIQRKSEYFKTDYLSRQTLTSFITGTLCFFLILGLWGLWNFAELVKQINTMDYVADAVNLGVLYLIFMIVYMFITFAVYLSRYHEDSDTEKEYLSHLEKLKKIYNREEKLKL